MLLRVFVSLLICGDTFVFLFGGESKVITFFQRGATHHSRSHRLEGGGTRLFTYEGGRDSIIIKERAGGSRLYTRTKEEK